MKRSALAVALLVVLSALGWLVWQMFVVEPARTDGAPTATARAAEADAATLPAETSASTPAQRTEDVKPPPARVEPPSAAPVPESYRRALSGIRGRLVEEDGKPVAGLRVELLELLGSMLFGDFEHALAEVVAEPPDLVVASGVSGADGVFELHGALGGAFHGLGVDVGGARGTLRFVDRTLAAGEVTDLGDIVLAACVTWKGTVVDDDGKPVPGARVRAMLLPPLVLQPGVADLARIVAVIETRSFGSETGQLTLLPASVRAWEAKLPFPTAKTGDDGVFELRGVPQGLATLVVDREGFAGTSKGPMPTGKRDRDVGKIELGRGRSVTGRVVDAAGKPVAGAEVAGGVGIEPARLAIGFAAAAPTDAEGRFVVEHLSEQGSDLRVAARASAGERWVVERTDGSEPVTITLPVGVVLDVKLVAVDGSIVPDAELLMRSIDGPPFLTFSPPQRVAPDRIIKVEDGKRRIEGVIPGRYELLGRAPQFAMARTVVDLRSETREATLQFTPPHDLLVSVTDAATQQPIEHALLTVSLDEREMPSLFGRRTDVAGNATLAALPGRKLRVRAFHPAYAPVTQKLDLADPAFADRRVGFALSAGAAVHGRIHVGSQLPTEPVLFVVDGPHTGDRDVDDEMPRFAVPGADGTFLLRGLQPGNVRWEVMPRLFAGDPQQAVNKLVEAAGSNVGKRGQLQLAAGETAELDVDLDPAHVGAPARITGIVRVRGSDAPLVIRLRGNGDDVPENERMRVIPTAANRTFTIDSLRPGYYSLSIERAVENQQPGAQGPSLQQDWFELAEGEQHSIDLSFEFAPAEVQVVDESGAPVPGAGLQCEWEVAMPSGGVDTQNLYASADQEGIARFEAPNPGKYTLTCAHQQKGRGRMEATLPSRERIVLQLDVGVPCRGRLDLVPDPDPDSELWLNVNVRRDDDRYENAAWMQLGKGQREFDFVGLREGKYRLQLYAGGGRHGQVDFDLGPNGDDHLVLKVKL